MACAAEMYRVHLNGCDDLSVSRNGMRLGGGIDAREVALKCWSECSMVLVSGDALRCQRARFIAPLRLSHTQLAGGSKSPKALVSAP